MIAEALQHCRGVGPVRLARLRAAGVRSWWDVLEDPLRIPASWREPVVAESRRCGAALAADDVRYFVSRFAPPDRWRILAHFFERASYFDVETMGLHYGAPITVIVCWHAGQLRTFVEHENLDSFLELLDEATLLVSFNGGSFDVPRLLDTFHLPELSCAHLDLRWSCYHQGMRGGLKSIAERMGIERPADLRSVDGEYAVQLWKDWSDNTDRAARAQLIRYCAADVVLLMLVAQQLVGRADFDPAAFWSQLPPASVPPVPAQLESQLRQPAYAYAASAPRRLRARLLRSLTG